MKKYKYIGTEEQLKEHGFEMEKVYGSGVLIHGTRSCDDGDGEIYIILTWGEDKKFDDELVIQWNDDRENNITPYIQDLIDAKLVEVIE